jgi:hypothetical protein
MSRLTLLTLALAPFLAALPASAAPAIDARLPVIAASVSDYSVHIRMPRGIVGHTSATAHRTITVEAFDAAGKSVGVSTAEVSKRLTYATIALTPQMTAAARLVVSTKSSQP